MKRITLTCPFTGLEFEATEFADGTILFYHPITGEETRMTWNSSCSRYMLPKSAFKHVEMLTSAETCELLELSKQRVNTLCLEGTLDSRLINGTRYVTRESAILYKKTRRAGRPKKTEV